MNSWSGEVPDTDEIQLSVIIVNYNGRSFLETCLSSLCKRLTCRYEIILVDNNSSDDSRRYLQEAWPEVNVVFSPENIGFARGNNLGAEHARGRYLLLLNSDTEMLADGQPLVDYLQDNPDTAVAGGRLLNPDGSIQPSVGYDHTPLRILFSWCLPRTCTLLSSRQLYEKRDEFYRDSHPDVHWVSGAFLCIKRRVWNELAGFDPDIFMYVEDVDLCRRVRERGGKVAYIAAADTCHFEGGGRKGMSGHALLATIDSYRLLLEKRYGNFVRSLTCAVLSLVFLVRSGLYLLSGTVHRDQVNVGKARFYFRGAGRLVGGGKEPMSADSIVGGGQ